ncbi:MCE family protein [Pseudonocardia sp. ICBG1122]|nr:MCE family protein [Pseudonocardia pini]
MALVTRNRVLLLVVVLVVAAGAAVWALVSPGTRTVTAYFDQTVNLYPHDEVRVLGVQVGTIESVEPRPDAVKVVMSYDADVPLPADATAAIISPTLVGVRYVQLGRPTTAARSSPTTPRSPASARSPRSSSTGSRPRSPGWRRRSRRSPPRPRVR